MRVRLQRGQLVRVIAAPPAVEALPADAEMATGEGRVAPVVQVVIHPLKPLNRIAAQLPPGAHKLAGTGWLSPSNLHGDTLLRVSPIILNENIILLNFSANDAGPIPSITAWSGLCYAKGKSPTTPLRLYSRAKICEATEAPHLKINTPGFVPFFVT